MIICVMIRIGRCFSGSEHLSECVVTVGIIIKFNLLFVAQFCIIIMFASLQSI